MILVYAPDPSSWIFVSGGPAKDMKPVMMGVKVQAPVFQQRPIKKPNRSIDTADKSASCSEAILNNAAFKHAMAASLIIDSWLQSNLELAGGYAPGYIGDCIVDYYVASQGKH